MRARTASDSPTPPPMVHAMLLAALFLPSRCTLLRSVTAAASAVRAAAPCGRKGVQFLCSSSPKQSRLNASNSTQADRLHIRVYNHTSHRFAYGLGCSQSRQAMVPIVHTVCPPASPCRCAARTDGAAAVLASEPQTPHAWTAPPAAASGSLGMRPAARPAHGSCRAAVPYAVTAMP